jgi:hypothetical protein
LCLGQYCLVAGNDLGAAGIGVGEGKARVVRQPFQRGADIVGRLAGLP